MSEQYIPQAGDVGTLATGTFSGFFIQFGTRSNADHVVVADGQGNVYEATPSKGVVKSPLERYANHKIAWDKHRAKTPEQRAIGIATAESYLGTRYAWRAIAIIALGILHLPVPRWFKSGMSAKAGLICSEFGAIVLRSMGFDILGDTPAFLIYPAELEELTLFL